MFGAGTQKIEDEIKKIFSFANIKRLDNDSIKDEEELKEIFSDIENFMAGDFEFLGDKGGKNCGIYGVFCQFLPLNFTAQNKVNKLFFLVPQ